MKIILASASPRRKELLKLIIDKFDVMPADADETLPENIAAEKAAEYLARVKAEAIGSIENCVVIGCDTVVVIDNIILGKPDDRQNCKNMLKRLSGRKHHVYTGVCLLYNGQTVSFTEKTEVYFRNLTEKEIEDYMDCGEPFDKAGGYGIQGKGALLVEKIHGDYFNVVGLPVSKLNIKLAKLLNNDL